MFELTEKSVIEFQIKIRHAINKGPYQCWIQRDIHQKILKTMHAVTVAEYAGQETADDDARSVFHDFLLHQAKIKPLDLRS